MTSKDLWIFRYLTRSRLILSLPFIGSFATWYFSHLFDLSRFATTLFFAVVRHLTINYSHTTGIHQSLLIRSVIRTLNIDFNWFLTCLDINSFKHFILLFYYMYFKLWEKDNKYNCIYCGPGGAGEAGYSNMKLVYMCRTGFKNGGLRERPLTENRGLSERPLTGKIRDFGDKNNKETHIFFKTRVFSICPGRKSRTKKCIYV